jgi:hypothetical protein
MRAAVDHPDTGRYLAGIRFDCSLVAPVPTYDLGARIRLKFEGQGRHHEILCPVGPWPFFAGAQSGFVLARYEVPNDVPRKAELEITVDAAAREESYARLNGVWFICTDNSV